MFGDYALDGVGAQLAVPAAWKERLVWLAVAFRAVQTPRAFAVGAVGGVARCLRPLPVVRTWGPRASFDVGAAQPGELGDAQAGLDREQRHARPRPAGADPAILPVT